MFRRLVGVLRDVHEVGCRRIVDTLRRHTEQRIDQAGMLLLHAARRVFSSRPTSGEPLPSIDHARFGLITVNFSTTDHLKLMLLTLSEQEQLQRISRVIIVDNGSRDRALPFLRELATEVELVMLLQRRHWLNHAAGLRAGIRALDEVERPLGEAERSNVLLLCDSDVVFRSRRAVADLATTMVSADAALAGEVRHVHRHPDIQASFVAVRRDVQKMNHTAPIVNHGSPTYWMQRSIDRSGLTVVNFPSNQAGHVLHRGRSGVAAAKRFRPRHSYASVQNSAAHYMGVPNGEGIWREIESRHAELLRPDAEGDLIAVLAERFREASKIPLVPDDGHSGSSRTPHADLSPETEPCVEWDVPLVWSDDVLSRSTADAILLAPSRGRPVTLTGSGMATWSLFETPTSPSEALELLVSMFGGSRATIEADLERFLRDLLTARLLNSSMPEGAGR